ncbi:hypothetical protein ABFA25_08915 [Mycobacterium lepromatosis]|nr:hypothetical protein [Mycobacterium lepromatosis]
MPMYQARWLIGVTAVVLPSRGVMYAVASCRVIGVLRSLFRGSSNCRLTEVFF